jgi:hypothetical protein
LKKHATTILGALAILIGSTSLTIAALAKWPADEPFPALLYRTVSPGTVTAVFAFAGLLGLASGFLLLSGRVIGAYLMIAGLAWDVLCQLAGLADGRMHCLLWMCVDAALIAALWSARDRS